MKNKLLKFLSCFASISAIGSTIAITSTSCGSSSEKIIPLPESVYDIDQNNVLKGFTSEFLANPIAYNGYNTMQIPASVTSIGDLAFIVNISTKNGPTSTIPDFVKNLIFSENSNCFSIGDAAFYSCSSLTFVTFPSNLSSIGESAFDSCSSLTSVDLSKCVNFSKDGLGKYAFKNCSSLISITFAKNINNRFGFNSAIFQNCSKLTSISLPNKLYGMDRNVFNNCSSLKYIAWDLPNDYQKIAINTDAFANISSSGTVESLNPSITSQELLNWIKTKGSFPSGDGWKPAK